MTTIPKEIMPRHAEFISVSLCGVKHFLWLTQG